MDRNREGYKIKEKDRQSLSARRAWIEISFDKYNSPTEPVALRKESVDRNLCRQPIKGGQNLVALRKESVDRNLPKRVTKSTSRGRSPQGERG